VRLEGPNLDKIDAALRGALAQAGDDEVLRVVLVLQPSQRGGSPAASEAAGSDEPDPKQFDSRRSYREALIRRQRTLLDQAHRETRRQLEELGLSPRGGDLTRAVVVDGKPEQIVKSLDLPDVISASLDRPIRLVRPSKSPEAD